MANIQLGWKVDANACISCRACEMACKVEYDIKAGQGRRRRVVEKTLVESGKVRTFFLSLACNQCEKPACIAACPESQPVGVGTAADSALWKDMTALSGGRILGVVRVNGNKCTGCRKCEWACPYGAPQYNPESKTIHKCEMCLQRLQNTNLHPSRRVGACVATCLGQAIKQDWVDTTATVAYNHTRKDTDNYVGYPLSGNGLLDGSESSGSQAYQANVAACLSNFVSPGDAVNAHNARRGDKYVADAAMTKPALKIRNRIYVNRSGSGVD